MRLLTHSNTLYDLGDFKEYLENDETPADNLWHHVLSLSYKMQGRREGFGEAFESVGPDPEKLTLYFSKEECRDLCRHFIYGAYGSRALGKFDELLNSLIFKRECPAILRGGLPSDNDLGVPSSTTIPEHLRKSFDLKPEDVIEGTFVEEVKDVIETGLLEKIAGGKDIVEMTMREFFDRIKAMVETLTVAEKEVLKERFGITLEETETNAYGYPIIKKGE